VCQFLLRSEVRQLGAKSNVDRIGCILIAFKCVCWLGGGGGCNEEVFFRALLCSVADAASFMLRLKVISIGLTH